MRSAIISLVRLIINIYFKLSMRIYFIFPKRFGPSGFGIFGYCIVSDIMYVTQLLVNFQLLSDKYIDIILVLSFLIAFANVLFLDWYFNVSELEDFLKREKEKGYNYNLWWSIGVWAYLIISFFPICYKFGKMNYFW